MQAVEDVNRQTGANVDPNADAGDMLQSNTRGLMAAMSTLPELTERKRTIDKHTALLGCIMKVGHRALHPERLHPMQAPETCCRAARGFPMSTLARAQTAEADYWQAHSPAGMHHEGRPSNIHPQGMPCVGTGPVAAI